MTTTNVKVITKKAKKVDVKKAAKTELSAMFAEFLAEKGIECNTNSENFGFTSGTLVVKMPNTDVQVKLITPKAGLERYQEVVYEEETEEDVEEVNEEIEELDLQEA